MICENPSGVRPSIHPSCFVAKTATIIGDVHLAEGCNVWPGAVIRADVCKIVLGKNCSIQENVTLHSEPNTELRLSDNVLVGHNAMVHGPGKIDENTLIGIQSTVLQGSQVGSGVLIGSGAVAKGVIEDFSLMLGVPAKLKKKLDQSFVDGHLVAINAYVQNGKAFKSTSLAGEIE